MGKVLPWQYHFKVFRHNVSRPHRFRSFPLHTMSAILILSLLPLVSTLKTHHGVFMNKLFISLFVVLFPVWWFDLSSSFQVGYEHCRAVVLGAGRSLKERKIM